jgi:hypothetical protein
MRTNHAHFDWFILTEDYGLKRYGMNFQFSGAGNAIFFEDFPVFVSVKGQGLFYLALTMAAQTCFT